MTSIHLPPQPDIPHVQISSTLLEEDIRRLERELEQELARIPQVTENKDTRHAPGKRRKPVTLLNLPEEAYSENTRLRRLTSSLLSAGKKTEVLKLHLAKTLQSHQPA